MYARPDSGTEVRRAGEDKSQVLVPHEFAASCLHSLLDLGQASAEAIEHLQSMHSYHKLIIDLEELKLDVMRISDGVGFSYLLHVAARLHGYDTAVVLLIHPDDERLISVVEDTTARRPVPVHTRGGEQGRDGLVEHDVLLDHLLVISLAYLLQRMVLAC